MRKRRFLLIALEVISEPKKRTTEALSYNGLVLSCPEIARLAREGAQSPAQGALVEDAET